MGKPRRALLRLQFRVRKGHLGQVKGSRRQGGADFLPLPEHKARHLVHGKLPGQGPQQGREAFFPLALKHRPHLGKLTQQSGPCVRDLGPAKEEKDARQKLFQLCAQRLHQLNIP